MWGLNSLRTISRRSTGLETRLFDLLSRIKPNIDRNEIEIPTLGFLVDRSQQHGQALTATVKPNPVSWTKS
jgi:hypothetical protein